MPWIEPYFKSYMFQIAENEDKDAEQSFVFSLSKGDTHMAIARFGCIHAQLQTEATKQFFHQKICFNRVRITGIYGDGEPMYH